MALNTRNLTAPGDVQSVDGARIAGSLGGGGSMPTWGVGDPVATAVAGFQQGMVKFKEHYDRAKADEFLINKKMELDKLYFDKDTGLFNTRKGEAAQGLYQEGAEYMRQMWDKDAMDNLSEEQRALASRGMTELFRSYSHTIAKYETDQMIDGTKNRINTNIFNFQNSVANGNFTEEDLGLALHGIRSGYESLGKLQGLDADTIKMNIDKATGEMLTKAAVGMAATRPEAAIGMMRSYKDLIPAMMYEPCMERLTKHANAVAKRNASVARENTINSDAEIFAEGDSLAEIGKKIQEKYKDNPKMAEDVFNRVLKIKRGENKARTLDAKIREAAFTEQLGVLFNDGNIGWRERQSKVDMMLANVTDPTEKARLGKIYQNLEASYSPDAEAVITENRGAVAECMQKINNGEVVNIRAEYGKYLKPSTIVKLEKDQKNKVIPRIAQTFENNAASFINGGSENENMVKELLGTTKGKELWKKFYDDLDDDVKNDPVKLNERAKKFWEQKLLDEDAWFGMRTTQKSVPLGYVPAYIEKKSWNRPRFAQKTGNTDRSNLRGVLDKAGAKKGGFYGQDYSDDQYSKLTGVMAQEELNGVTYGN